MRRVLLFSIAAGVAAGVHAERVVDDRGKAVALERPAARIVSLAPYLAEMAFAAGAGRKLVGVSSSTRQPEAARRLPVVASNGRVDIERVIAIRPDLVLAWKSGNSPLQVERLERFGFPVLVTETSALSDIPRIVRLVGAVAGTSEVAARSADALEEKTRALRERYSLSRGVSVFLEIWHRPMLTVSDAHLMSDAVRLCGGRNVFAVAKTLTALVSREQILAARPQAIVVARGFGSESPEAWRGFETVPAVREGHIYAIDPDLLHDLGPRAIDGASALCERLELARR